MTGLVGGQRDEVAQRLELAGAQPDLLQGLDDQRPQPGLAAPTLRVDTGADRVVELLDVLLAVALLRGDDHTHRAPGVLEALAVVLGQVLGGEAADEATLRDLAFAWRSVRAVKSNGILLAKDGAAVGVGMGQVSRVDSCYLAAARAEDRAQGSVAASDAFFPFADGPDVLLKAGVKAIVQPGGSVRDQEVIEAVSAAGVTMYFTGTRHFFH